MASKRELLQLLQEAHYKLARYEMITVPELEAKLARSQKEILRLRDLLLVWENLS